VGRLVEDDSNRLSLLISLDPRVGRGLFNTFDNSKDGRFCAAAMHRERITDAEALSAIRSGGGRGIEEVERLILESDGTISVSLKDERSAPPKH
jgi:hypothetical protein